MFVIRSLIVSLLFITTLATAAQQEYIRDYKYPATRYDSEYTSRIRAIDGVKQTLLDELGVYVSSVIDINKDQFGNAHMSQDIQTITAGIISLIVLQENWNRIHYYLQAKMKADPDEVLRSVNALQQNEELEVALRDSMRELEAARQQIIALKQQLETPATKTKPEKEAQLVQQYQLAVSDLETEAVFQQAMRAYIAGEFAEMLRLMKQLSDQGYAKAQSKLGWIYERGIGVKVNYKKALELYQKSKNKDDGFAYVRLGFMYQRGVGVEKDTTKSVELIKKSIARGHGHGHALMGYAYFVRAGVARDYDLARKHAELAAEKGSAWGYAWLGRTYEFGLGIDVDYEKAFNWYSKAIKSSSPLGLGLYGHMYLKGRHVEKDEDKAFKYIKAGADRSNPLATAMLGILYENGIGVDDEDEKKAFELYKNSASQGNTLGMMRYARAYWEGIGIEEDKAKGKKLVLDVVKKGMPKALKVHMLMTRDEDWPWAEFFFDEGWNPS